MYIINITNARKDLYQLVHGVILGGQPICIVTKQGNAILISEKKYASLNEARHLSPDNKHK